MNFENFIKKETLVQEFYCEFCEISKNTFFIEHLRWLLLIVISRDLYYQITDGASVRL